MSRLVTTMVMAILLFVSGAYAQEDMTKVQRIETTEELAALIAEMEKEKYGEYGIYHDESNLYEWKERFLPFDPGADLIHKSRVVLGLAFLVFFGDEEFSDNVQNGKDHYSLADFGDFFGGVGSVIIPASAYVYGYLAKDKYTKDTGVIMGRSVLISATVVQALKMTFHRHRPNEGDGPYKFGGPDYENTENMSMPSGHTAAAFAMATVIADRYGERSKYIPVVAYSLATITAWSRVYDNRHWLSDTMVGAVLAHLITKQILKKNSGSDKGFYISPIVDFEGNFMVHVVYERRDKGKYPLAKVKKCQNHLTEIIGERNAKMECFKMDIRSKWAD